MRIALVLILLAGCGDPPPPPAPELPFQELGGFEHKEKMPLPENVTKWSGKVVRATGIINPGKQMRDLSQFYLVKDRASCCFGQRPQLNHYIAVTLKAGAAPTDETRAKLLEHVSREIGKFARPDALRFAAALPKTRSGKIMRRLLKDLAAGVESKQDTSTLEDLNVLAQLRGAEE